MCDGGDVVLSLWRRQLIEEEADDQDEVAQFCFEGGGACHAALHSVSSASTFPC